MLQFVVKIRWFSFIFLISHNYYYLIIANISWFLFFCLFVQVLLIFLKYFVKLPRSWLVWKPLLWLRSIILYKTWEYVFLLNSCLQPFEEKRNRRLVGVCVCACVCMFLGTGKQYLVHVCMSLQHVFNLVLDLISGTQIDWLLPSGFSQAPYSAQPLHDGSPRFLFFYIVISDQCFS